MTIYEVTAPNGQVLEIEGDTPPTETDLDEIFKTTNTQAKRKGLFDPTYNNEDLKADYQELVDKRKEWEQNHPFISNIQKDFQPGYRSDLIDWEEKAKYGINAPLNVQAKNLAKKFAQEAVPAANLSAAILTDGAAAGAKGLWPIMKAGAKQGLIQGGVLGASHELGDNGLSLNVIPQTLGTGLVGGTVGLVAPPVMLGGGKVLGAAGNVGKKFMGKLAQISPETVEQVVKPTSKALDYTKDKAQDVLRSTTERVRNAYNNLLEQKGEAISAAEENLRNIPERVNAEDVIGDIRGTFDKYQGENINPARNMAGGLEENLIDLVNSGSTPTSILENDKALYLKAIRNVKNKVGKSGSRIPVLSETPPIWVENGLPKTKIIMKKESYKKAGSLPNRKRINHHISDEVLDNLPELLQDPLYILNSDTEKGSFVGVLNAFDPNGYPVNVAIKPTKDGLQVNLLKSAYGRENFENWLPKQKEAGNLLYKKSEQSLRPHYPMEELSSGQGEETVPTNIINDNVGYFNSLSPIDLQKVKQQVGQMTNWADTTRPKIQNTVLEQVYGKLRKRLEGLSPELAQANKEYAYLKGFQDDEGLKTILAPGGAIDRASTALKNYNSTVSKGNTAQNVQALEDTLVNAGEEPFLATMDDINAAMDLLKQERTGLGSIAELGKSIVTRPALKAARWYNRTRLPQAFTGLRNNVQRAVIPLMYNTPRLYGGVVYDEEY